MIAVVYDPSTGRILQSLQGAPSIVALDTRPKIEVLEMRDDYDVTHQVVDGKLVGIDQ